jgi:nucleotide-binding universal stress UspA family protein
MTTPMLLALDSDDAVRTPGPVRTPTSIVVATDGSVESDAALAFAGQLADDVTTCLNAVAVVEPVPLLHEWPQYGAASAPLDATAVARNVATRVKAQIDRILPANRPCSFSVVHGAIGSAIARFAREVRADLIVAGRGRHNLFDRLMGEEHLVKLLRVVGCPVLAAEPTLEALPKRIVIGVDFSAGEMAVARAAISIADGDAVLYLVHVKPGPPFGTPHGGHRLTSDDEGVRARLERFRTELKAPARMQVEPVVVHGQPGVALADFSRQAGADLIAAGVHGGGLFSRLVIGKVTSHLLRFAGCSLLAVPSRTV